MRITNNMLTRGQIASLRSGTAALERAQSRVQSGLKIQRASDDPAGASDVMGASGSLRAIEQYRRNVAAAGSRLAAEEPVLDGLATLLERAKELAVAQTTATATPQTRETVATEVDQLLRHAVSLGATRFGDEYLFGGHQAQTSPFGMTTDGQGRIDFTVGTPQGTRSVEIAAGQRFVATHDGQQAFVDTGVLAALRDLSHALRSNAPGAVENAMVGLDGAHNRMQVLVGELGARQAMLQVTTSNLDALETGLRTFKSDLEEVDFEEAVTELVTRQTSYQAALLASSKVLGLNLTDYLR